MAHNICKVCKDGETVNTTILNGETSGSNSFADMLPLEEFTRYEAYVEQNASNYNAPSSVIMHYNVHNDIIEKSIVINDDFGRQKWRMDYNNHGYSDHSIPHLHERDDSPGYDPVKAKGNKI